MVAEIQPLYDIGNMLYNIGTTSLTLTKAKKRWRLAYFTIYFSQAIAKNVISKVLPVSKFPPYSDHHFYGIIDQTQLVNIVQNKDLETLHGLDGVKGLAKTLHTHLENGIDCHDINERTTVFGF
ncbi:putative P-type Ca(2+) transporter [Helianthus anomalus]